VPSAASTKLPAQKSSVQENPQQGSRVPAGSVLLQVASRAVRSNRKAGSKSFQLFALAAA
jgi:hypothetical protein